LKTGTNRRKIDPEGADEPTIWPAVAYYDCHSDNSLGWTMNTEPLGEGRFDTLMVGSGPDLVPPSPVRLRFCATLYRQQGESPRSA